MAHLDRFKLSNTYEPFNRIAERKKHPVPALSSWMISAESCDNDLETDTKTSFYTEERRRILNCNNPGTAPVYGINVSLYPFLNMPDTIEGRDSCPPGYFPIMKNLLINMAHEMRSIGINARLPDNENEIDIHAIPKFNDWLAENPEAAAHFHQVMEIAITIE